MLGQENHSLKQEVQRLQQENEQLVVDKAALLATLCGYGCVLPADWTKSMESYSKACCDNGGALGIKNSLDSCNQTNRGHPNSGSCDCKGSVQGVDVDSGLPQSSHSFHTLSFARSTSETNKKKSNYPQQDKVSGEGQGLSIDVEASATDESRNKCCGNEQWNRTSLEMPICTSDQARSCGCFHLGSTPSNGGNSRKRVSASAHSFAAPRRSLCGTNSTHNALDHGGHEGLSVLSSPETQSTLATTSRNHVQLDSPSSDTKGCAPHSTKAAGKRSHQATKLPADLQVSILEYPLKKLRIS
jgi:hypothetical protein